MSRFQYEEKGSEKTLRVVIGRGGRGMGASISVAVQNTGWVRRPYDSTTPRDPGHEFLLGPKSERRVHHFHFQHMSRVPCTSSVKQDVSKHLSDPKDG